MATVATTRLGLGGEFRSRSEVVARSDRRRRITPEAGRALELLGHAIEYLTDELVHEGTRVSAHEPQVEAIQLLMAKNREVYYDCPAVPTLKERLRGLFAAHLGSGVLHN